MIGKPVMNRDGRIPVVKNYVRILRNGWIIILVATLIGGAAATVYSLTRTQAHSATVTLLSVNQTRVPTYLRLATTEAVISPVAESATPPLSMKVLSNSVEAETPQGTNILRLTVTNASSATATELANAIADSLIEAAEDWESSIPDSTITAPLRVVQPATITSDSASEVGAGPIAVGIVLGAVFGTALALLLDLRGAPIRSRREMGDASQIPIVGDVSGASVGTLTQSPLDAGQASTLDTLFQFLGEGEKTSFAVVDAHGALPGSGALEIALAFSATGRRTVLVDADLEARSLTTSLNLDAEVGLADHLIGATSIADAMTENSVPGLTFMPSGTNAPNPAALVASARFTTLVLELEQTFERVVVQLGSAPAPASAAQACGGGVVVIAAVGKTNNRKLSAEIDVMLSDSSHTLGLLAANKPSGRANSSI